jgi:hypothetical protein
MQLIGDVLGVDDVPVASKHKDGRLQQTPLLEPHAILLAELLTAMSREGLVQHARALLPVCLHLGRIHTHGVDACIWWQRRAESLPPARHQLAERLFKAVHDVEQAHHPCQVGQVDSADDHIRQIQVVQGEVGGGISRVQVQALDRELLGACERFASALFSDGLLSDRFSLDCRLSSHQSSA